MAASQYESIIIITVIPFTLKLLNENIRLFTSVKGETKCNTIGSENNI